MVPRRFHGGLGAFWWKLFSVVLVFVLFSLLIAPLGVLAHHENEAEHQQTALANSVTNTVPLDLPSTTAIKKATPPADKMASPPTDLVIETISKPSNAASLRKVTKGDVIKVHYTGTLFTTGAKFDSSRDRPEPFKITLGVGQVIKGWDEGIDGMVVGETRKLTVPPQKAYGDRGFGTIIPPKSTLVFEVELLGVEAPKVEL